MNAPVTPVTKDQQIQNLQSQLAAALQAIEKLAPPAAEKLPSGPVVYFSSSAFIKVPIMRSPGYCDHVQFIKGRLETSDPAVIAVMEATIKAGGSGFYHGTPPETTREEETMKADMAASAASAHAKMLAAGEKTA